MCVNVCAGTAECRAAVEEQSQSTIRSNNRGVPKIHQGGSLLGVVPTRWAYLNHVDIEDRPQGLNIISASLGLH